MSHLLAADRLLCSGPFDLPGMVRADVSSSAPRGVLRTLTAPQYCGVCHRNPTCHSEPTPSQHSHAAESRTVSSNFISHSICSTIGSACVAHGDKGGEHALTSDGAGAFSAL